MPTQIKRTMNYMEIEDVFCWNLAVGFDSWPNTNSEILLAHSCLAGDGTKV
jgi:hypothetical protein